MARINPQTPLSRLINTRMAELVINRTDLVERLGYANPSKGLRRFDEFMATGRPTTHLLKGLPEVLGLDAAEVEAVSATTRKRIADKEETAARERFHPHIIVQAERQDGKRIPLLFQAFIWGNKVIVLPDEIDGLSSAQQVRQAARIVRQHYRELGGELGIWGTIKGYRLRRTYDHSVLLNVDGTTRDGFNRDAEPPAPEIQIKGKRIPLEMFTAG